MVYLVSIICGAAVAICGYIAVRITSPIEYVGKKRDPLEQRRVRNAPISLTYLKEDES